MPKAGTKINFTKQAIAAIEPPTHQERIYIYDRRTPSLAVCVTGAGAKTFYVYKRACGRPVRIRLGRFPEITVEQARKQAAVLLADIARGIDPLEQKRALRRQCTFGELFDHYLESHAKVHCRAKSWGENERMFNKHLAAWRARRIGMISTAEVAALHGRIGKKAPYQANRVLALINTLFNYGRRTLKWTRPNPCEGIRRFPEQTRDRFLDADELRRFFEALAEEVEPFRSFFAVLLLTGARRGNVQSMRWTDVDLNRGVWRIPDTQSKNRQPMVVILVPEVVTILRGRHTANGAAGYVFSSYGTTGHLIEPKSAWKRILERASLDNCRMHDLRRTLGSWQAAGGASLPVIGASLGHRSVATTAIYARLSVDPVRESVNKAATAMLTAANGTDILNGGGPIDG